MDELSWQEFEEYIRDVLSHHDFVVKFRKVFKTPERGYQIDVVGLRNDLCLCIDCKKYGRGRHRSSSLKTEAKKHYDRCVAHEEAFDVRSIPIIVTWLDDNLMIENGCVFVPSHMLNDFLLNLDSYLDMIGY
ncbi:restriction endonuclease [Methanooceanicella nereidis]|nr:restriction endonuclease [Methanocella sp. CWC-04]